MKRPTLFLMSVLMACVAQRLVAGHIFRSDTGQLVLNSTVRRFTAVAPRARIVVGFFPGVPDTVPVALGDVTVSCRVRFAAISIIVLDNASDVRSSHKLLVTAVARAENTGQATLSTHPRPANPVRNDRAMDADTGGFLPQVGSLPIAAFGRAPVLAEPVDARVTVPGRGWRAFPLDERGHRRAALPVETTPTEVRTDLRAARSPRVLLRRP